MTIAMFFSSSPGTAALAQLNGSAIYISSAWVNGMSTGDQQAMLLHEMVHNLTALTDDRIQTMLSLSTKEPSQNISDKLKKDCFQ